MEEKSIITDIPYFQTPNDIFETNLTNNEKITYIYLTRCANNGKIAFPSHDTIAKKCGFSKATSKRSIAVLVEKGFIVKQLRWKNGKNYSNTYKVNLDITRVMMNLSGVTVNSGGYTMNRNKELGINKSLEKNKYIHQTKFDGLIHDYSLERFGKPLRISKGAIVLNDFDEFDDEDMYTFLDNNITCYDQCNLDYLEKIQGRAKRQIGE